MPALYSNYLLINIINDILDMAQMNMGELKLYFSEFSLSELCLECLKLIKI